MTNKHTRIKGGIGEGCCSGVRVCWSLISVRFLGCVIIRASLFCCIHFVKVVCVLYAATVSFFVCVTYNRSKYVILH
jgi:hypothetical protein